MSEVVAEREFELGDTGMVIVRFFRPVQCDDDFRCNYEIDWPDRKRVFRASGVDGVQALIHALKMAHADLKASPEGRKGDIRWLGMEDLGLPEA